MFSLRSQFAVSFQHLLHFVKLAKLFLSVHIADSDVSYGMSRFELRTEAGESIFRKLEILLDTCRSRAIYFPDAHNHARAASLLTRSYRQENRIRRSVAALAINPGDRSGALPTAIYFMAIYLIPVRTRRVASVIAVKLGPPPFDVSLDYDVAASTLASSYSPARHPRVRAPG